MKKIIFVISMLLTVGLLGACSSDDEMVISNSTDVVVGYSTGSSTNSSDSNGLINESVLSFFKEKLQKAYLAADYQATEGFLFKYDTCYRIDSMEELASLYNGSDVLPEIDFENYTLLLGSKIYHDADTDIENYKPILFETENEYHLNLYTHHLEGEWSRLCITMQILYFGFYPKLKDKEIVVNLIYE
jgi:hypothetical protein